MAVSAETMNARPVRDAVRRRRRCGVSPASSLLDEAQQDQRRELGARRDHERSADRGHRAQLEARAKYANSDAAPTAMSTGTSESSARTTLRSRTVRNRKTKRIAR